MLENFHISRTSSSSFAINWIIRRERKEEENMRGAHKSIKKYYVM